MIGEIAPAYVVLALSVIAQAIISWAAVKQLQGTSKDHEERLRVLEKFQAGEEAREELESRRRGKP